MWGAINPGRTENYERKRMFHKAVLGNEDIIYYIGGISPDGRKLNGEYIFSPLSMSLVITFDMRKGEWGYSKIAINNKDFYPSGRIHHSANLCKEQNWYTVPRVMKLNSAIIVLKN